jgi:hypothetical protein
LYFVGCLTGPSYYRDKKVVGVFVRFSLRLQQGIQWPGYWLQYSVHTCCWGLSQPASTRKLDSRIRRCEPDQRIHHQITDMTEYSTMMHGSDGQTTSQGHYLVRQYRSSDGYEDLLGMRIASQAAIEKSRNPEQRLCKYLWRDRVR